MSQLLELCVVGADFRSPLHRSLAAPSVWFPGNRNGLVHLAATSLLRRKNGERKYSRRRKVEELLAKNLLSRSRKDPLTQTLSQFLFDFPYLGLS